MLCWAGPWPVVPVRDIPPPWRCAAWEKKLVGYILWGALGFAEFDVLLSWIGYPTLRTLPQFARMTNEFIWYGVVFKDDEEGLLWELQEVLPSSDLTPLEGEDRVMDEKLL